MEGVAAERIEVFVEGVHDKPTSSSHSLELALGHLLTEEGYTLPVADRELATRGLP